MKKTKYLTTGEFADLCQVEKHVIFYYDQIDLLKPFFTEKNGYRYYSYHQYDTFLVITLLKNLGMPLKEIKKYLKDRSPARFQELLDVQLARLNAEAESLRKKVQYVSEMRELTKEAVCAEKGVIRTVTLPPAPLICSRNPGSGQSLFMDDFSKEYTGFCKSNHLSDSSMVGTALRIEADGTVDTSRFSYLYAYAAGGGECEGASEIAYPGVFPGGKYLTVYHQGEYETLDYAYDALLSYARENGLPLGDFAYEEYIMSDAAVNSPSEYVTKIAVVIRE
jgi:DNA-binding transcriptional MerR regulator